MTEQLDRCKPFMQQLRVPARPCKPATQQTLSRFGARLIHQLPQGEALASASAVRGGMCTILKHVEREERLG